MAKLEGKIAVVTGGSRGIGASTAKGVLFVCESEYMTGQCLNLNGGLYML